MTVKLLTEHHLEILNLKGGCTGSSESTLVKMPHCWKSHVTVHIAEISTDIKVFFSVNLCSSIHERKSLFRTLILTFH